ncbi:MAG TPA: amidohydrolase family protein [Jatrophihabitans sp.]|uniref:amidohydrolase family protein n=1 Tax=Jatrophihabitans sp. TaxID=1932789 RepID=UPI002EEEA07B
MTDQDQPPPGRRGVRLRAALADRARTGLGLILSRRLKTGAVPSRGVAFVGTVWTGGADEPRFEMVVLDGAGRVADIRAERSGLPSDLLVLGGVSHWVVPGITDAHVHLSPPTDGTTEPLSTGLETGLVGIRDLAAPLRQALRWRTGHQPPPPGWPVVAVSGPVLIAPGGYPASCWAGDGDTEFVNSPVQARWAVQRLAADGMDVIKLGLDPGPHARPVPPPAVVRAVVNAAHDAGLAVVAHALSVELVSRAVDAGVDELAHIPTERLPADLIERIAGSGIKLTSTLQRFFSEGFGRDAAANAADLVAAGATLLYGTDGADQGRSGAVPAVDPRELDRLAAAGLGRLGALRAATEHSAGAAGMRRRTGRLRVGEPAALVLLPASPLVEPGVWRTPSAVFADGRLTVSPNAPSHRAARPIAPAAGQPAT